jgi:hypothetical protein
VCGLNVLNVILTHTTFTYRRINDKLAKPPTKRDLFRAAEAEEAQERAASGEADDDEDFRG